MSNEMQVGDDKNISLTFLHSPSIDSEEFR